MKLLAPIFLSILLLGGARVATGQGISPSTPPPPPPPPPEAPPPEPPVAPAQPVFDPLHAEKSIEVGTFYMKKGNYDAAIDRFEDATRFQPKLARPWKLMGEAYEKKHAYGRAVECYKKYLEIYPGAEDAAKVTKLISTLEEKVVQESSKRPAH